jgi:dUTP diphosphatase
MPRRSLRSVVFERVAGVTPQPLPQRATEGSACFDLAAAEAVRLRRGKVDLVRTGFRMRCPADCFLEVRPRSGLSRRGVLMVNAPGTIDADYPGEVMVPMTYLFPGTYAIAVGDRIAQIRLVEGMREQISLGEVPRTTSRRGGFGSTGR